MPCRGNCVTSGRPYEKSNRAAGSTGSATGALASPAPRDATQVPPPWRLAR